MDSREQLIAFKSDEHTSKIMRRYHNRELSWIEFNSRVLQYASDSSLPLLERIRFLGIVSSNLDEFVMKRVGGLKRQVLAGITAPAIDGLTPAEQLGQIRSGIIPQLRRMENLYRNELVPSLEVEGIELLKWEDLSIQEQEFAFAFFCERVFPLLTPLGVDAGHPFPFLSNLSTSLGVALAHPDRDETLFARIKTSGLRPQWISLRDAGGYSGFRFINVMELVMRNIEACFPGMTLVGCMPFRVTRNAALGIDPDSADDLLDVIEEELRQRRFAQVVRLQHGPDPDRWILDFLMAELRLGMEDVYEIQGELDYTSLQPIMDLALPEHSFPRFTPVTPPALYEEHSIFQAIRYRDVLVHHPYESFLSSVEKFVREAAEDPDVLSIKMTVYRLGDETPLIPYLILAAEMGKQVVVLVELKARFDEERNIQWAEALEKAGVHVVYGIPGLKTHAKTLLVVRKDADTIRSYAHIGTGNYHAKTANLYTDLGLFTAKKTLTEDLTHFFNYLTGRSLKADYEKLLVAPVNMADSFLQMIEQEIQNARCGKPANIVAKMNSLEDSEIIDALYQASQAGVRVDLIIRGVCCLVPGVQGLSENIQVLSLIGRLLEHSRVFYFQNGADDPVDGRFFLGSADWMSRNLHRRVEVIVPVEDRAHRLRCRELFELCLQDRHNVWEMNSDGTYTRRVSEDEYMSGSQERLIKLAGVGYVG